MLTPVNRYKELLIEAGVIEDSKFVLIEPLNKHIEKFDIGIEALTILQQGAPKWILQNKILCSRIKQIFTPNFFVSETTKEIKPTFILEFPIKNEFEKLNNWNEREDAIYYHGRVVPEKAPIRDLEDVCEHDIKVVMRGPVCKMYWINKDLEGDEYDDYRERFFDLVKDGKILHLQETDDSKVIIEDLNRYKFYFTLSVGEAFNIALQEAIACGTIPIVRKNGAYWWAHDLFVGFSITNTLFEYYSMYKDRNLEEYSDLIAKEIKARCSLKAICKKYEYQKTHVV